MNFGIDIPGGLDASVVSLIGSGLAGLPRCAVGGVAGHITGEFGGLAGLRAHFLPLRSKMCGKTRRSLRIRELTSR
ncbi:MAG: hypothetical protein ACFHWZ_10705 [Phycisphaerales bacterium]